MDYENCLLQMQSGIINMDCLNNWSIMRQIAIYRLQQLFKDTVVDISVNMIEEMKRLYGLWLNYRETFIAEVNNWYEKEPT